MSSMEQVSHYITKLNLLFLHFYQDVMPFLHERWICPLQRLFPLTIRLKVMETQFKLSRKQILYVSFVYLVMLSTVQIIHYSLVGSLINNGLERCTRKWSWPNLRYSPGICLGRTDENHK
jgi:hypothetical protein